MEITNAMIQEQMDEVSLYPNPASDILTLEGFMFQELSVYSLDGLLVGMYVIDSEIVNINVLTLNPGMYLIKSAEGRFIFNKL